MALVSDPTYPAAGDTCTLSISSASGTEWVFELTKKPSASALPFGFLTTSIPQGTSTPTSSRQVLDLGVETDEFTPDVAGYYDFTIYDYRHVVGTPSYPGDPSGEVRHELVATQTGTLHVGDAVDYDVMTEWGSGCTVRLTVVDQTVRGAELVNPTDEHARVACLSATLTTPLSALVGVTITNLGTELQAGTNDLLAKYEAHRILESGVHTIPDAYNVVGVQPAYSQSAAVAVINAIRAAYYEHATEFPAAAQWHTTADLSSLPIVGKATNLPEAWLLMTDLRERCYEAHRLLHAGDTPAVHGANQDTTNALTSAKPLDTLVALLLTELFLAGPTAAINESQGILQSAAKFGTHTPRLTTLSTEHAGVVAYSPPATVHLVTSIESGTVRQFGTTPNLVLCSDGSTDGGEWRSYVALSTVPAATGDIRLGNASSLRVYTTGGDGSVLATTVADTNKFALAVGDASRCYTQSFAATRSISFAAELRDLGPGGALPVNVETIVGTRVLVAGADAQVQLLDAAAAADVTLPANDQTGLYYWIENVGDPADGTITVKTAGGVTVATLTPTVGSWFKCTGSGWATYGRVDVLPSDCGWLRTGTDLAPITSTDTIHTGSGAFTFMTSSAQFASTVSSPSLTHVAADLGHGITASSTTIQAQSNLHSDSGTGGGLSLLAGSGFTANGAVSIGYAGQSLATQGTLRTGVMDWYARNDGDTGDWCVLEQDPAHAQVSIGNNYAQTAAYPGVLVFDAGTRVIFRCATSNRIWVDTTYIGLYGVGDIKFNNQLSVTVGPAEDATPGLGSLTTTYKAGNQPGSGSTGQTVALKAGEGPSATSDGDVSIQTARGTEILKYDASTTETTIRGNPYLLIASAVQEQGPGGAAPINVETLSSDKTLVAGTDAQYQSLTAAVARNVTLPADSFTGLYYWIESLGAGTLTVKRAGGSTVTTLPTNVGAWFKCTGATWVFYGKCAIGASSGSCGWERVSTTVSLANTGDTVNFDNAAVTATGNPTWSTGTGSFSIGGPLYHDNGTDRFAYTVTATVYQEDDSTTAATGRMFTFHAQDMIGSGATVGGSLAIRAGHGATHGKVLLQDAAGIDRIYIYSDDNVVLNGSSATNVDVGGTRYQQWLLNYTYLTASCPTMAWAADTASAKIYVSDRSSGSGVKFTLAGQKTTASGETGGEVAIEGGNAVLTGGIASMRGGDATTTGGAVAIRGGDATTKGGDVALDAGHGASHGAVFLRDADGNDRVSVYSDDNVILNGKTYNYFDISGTRHGRFESGFFALTANCPYMVFDYDVSAPCIYQSTRSSGNGETFVVRAQITSAASGTGGLMDVAGGTGGTSGTGGGARLRGGDCTSGTGGGVAIYAGNSASGTPGMVSIGSGYTTSNRSNSANYQVGIGKNFLLRGYGEIAIAADYEEAVGDRQAGIFRLQGTSSNAGYVDLTLDAAGSESYVLEGKRSIVLVAWVVGMLHGQGTRNIAYRVEGAFYHEHDGDLTSMGSFPTPVLMGGTDSGTDPYWYASSDKPTLRVYGVDTGTWHWHAIVLYSITGDSDTS